MPKLQSEAELASMSAYFKNYATILKGAPVGNHNAAGHGVTTGTPVTLHYSKNTVSSKAFGVPEGMDFGQKLEPSGDYLNVDHNPITAPDSRWRTGKITFKNPLVLEHKNTTSTGWKKYLSDQFKGKTGKALSKAVMVAGHDGIITHDKYGLSETVNLSGIKSD